MDGTYVKSTFEVVYGGCIDLGVSGLRKILSLNKDKN